MGLLSLLSEPHDQPYPTQPYATKPLQFHSVTNPDTIPYKFPTVGAGDDAMGRGMPCQGYRTTVRPYNGMMYKRATVRRRHDTTVRLYDGAIIRQCDCTMAPRYDGAAVRRTMYDVRCTTVRLYTKVTPAESVVSKQVVAWHLVKTLPEAV